MPKLLVDFLQEQQEPFAMEVYLVERGYAKALHNSANYVAPNCSYFLRGVFGHFVAANLRRGRKNSLAGKSKRRWENIGNDGTINSFTSCSESDGEASRCSEVASRWFDKCGNCFLEEEVDADTNSTQRGEEEDCKQLSPVSVLENTESDQDSPFHYKTRELKQYIINKAELQQRKQLLIDCTQELVDKYCRKKEKKREEIRAVFGVGEIWKHVCENMWKWSHDSTTETNILTLLHSDLLASIDEWNVVIQHHKIDICMEIENGIWENVINEVITNLLA